MDKASRYAIILPVYNGLPYIAQCVDGILSQSRSDYELIVLDNASTDGTSEYLRLLRDPRVTVITSTRRCPIEANWAKIKQLPIADSVFVTIIGHDDVLYPDFLDTIDRLIEQHPRGSLFQTLFDLIDRSGNIIRACRPIAEIETADDFLHFRIANQRDSFGTGYVFRFGDYRRVGGIPAYPGLLWADDMLWLRLCGGSFKACAQIPSFAYRFHEHSASYRTGSDSLVLLNALTAFANDLDALPALASRSSFTRAIVTDWLVEHLATRGRFSGRSAELRGARRAFAQTLLRCYPEREREIAAILSGRDLLAARYWWTTSSRLLKHVTPPLLYSYCARLEPQVRVRLGEYVPSLRTAM